MATLTRFFFTRYKEVSYETPSGQVSDEPYGSFSLDNPSQTNSGTIHFFGVMRTIHLLGDLRKVTIDTGNVSLIQYDSLSQSEIDQRISSGQFQVNDQRIGWVDIGKASPSFFYSDCNLFSQNTPDGKRPTVNYFYDITQLGLDGNIVSGEPTPTVTQFLTGGAPAPELQVVGTYNLNETNLSWGPYPTVRYTNPSFQGDDIRQFGVDFGYYIERVINGGTWPSRNGQIQSGVVLNVTSANGTQLLRSTKEEHFDNQNSEKVDNRYGSVRRTIISGFRSPSQSSVGPCLELPYIVSVGVAPGGVTPPSVTPIDVEERTQEEEIAFYNRLVNDLISRYPGFRYDPNLPLVNGDIYVFSNEYSEMHSVFNTIDLKDQQGFADSDFSKLLEESYRSLENE